MEDDRGIEWEMRIMDRLKGLRRIMILIRSSSTAAAGGTAIRTMRTSGSLVRDSTR